MTGRTAFHFACKSSLRLYNAILNKEPLFNEDIWKRCSSDCIDFIQKCLTKDQTVRPNVNELFKHPWFAQLAKVGMADREAHMRNAYVDSDLRKNIEFVNG